MKVAIGGQKSTNRQFHVYVCFKWRAVSEGERDRSSQIFSNFIKGLRSKIMQVCTGGSHFSNNFSTLVHYIILIAKTLSGILLVTQDDPLFCQNHAKSTSNPCCRQKYNLYQQTPQRPNFFYIIPSPLFDKFCLQLILHSVILQYVPHLGLLDTCSLLERTNCG